MEITVIFQALSFSLHTAKKKEKKTKPHHHSYWYTLVINIFCPLEKR